MMLTISFRKIPGIFAPLTGRKRLNSTFSQNPHGPPYSSIQFGLNLIFGMVAASKFSRFLLNAHGQASRGRNPITPQKRAKLGIVLPGLGGRGGRRAGRRVANLQVFPGARDRTMAQVLPHVLDSRLSNRLHSD